MKKWIVFIVAVVISSALFAWRSGWLPSASSTISNDILTFVPADTVYYFGGHSTDDMAKFMEGYPLMASSPSQSQVWDTLLASADEDNSPKARFFAHLLQKYRSFNNGTLGGFAKFSGLSFMGSYAVFSDGMIPVARVDIASSDVFNALIEDAVANSEWKYTWDDLGAAKVRLWQLNESDDTNERDIYLAVANHENSAVITFVTSDDDVQTKQRRFGLVKPKKSLATNTAITDAKTRYNYTDDMLGFIDFNGLAQAVLAPESNSLGRDLLAYLPKEQFAQYQQKLSPACRAEYSELVSAVPRFVMGYQALDITTDKLTFDVHSALEINNVSVVSELQKMQGHLPLHSTIATDKLAAFGVGINATNLAPALTALWSQFTNTPFKCEHLQAAQAKMREQNPAMLGMAMSMVGGVQGFGASVFDVTMGESNTLPEMVDFMASIATENPVMLVNMAKILPFLGDITLPSDGTAIALNLPMVPPTVEVKGAIKGKHIVVFAGKKSSVKVDELINEPITANGLYSMAFNYRKFGGLITSDNLHGLVSSVGGVGGCIQQYEMAHMFQNFKMDVGIVINTQNEGIVTQYNGSMDKPILVEPRIAGKYRVDMLDDNCEWQGGAQDDIRQDGTGSYTEKSADEACDLYVSNYSWVQKGDVISFGSSEQTRALCTDEFPAPANDIYTCHLMNVTADSFQCLYDPATEMTSLYRYKRI